MVCRNANSSLEEQKKWVKLTTELEIIDLYMVIMAMPTES